MEGDLADQIDVALSGLFEAAVQHLKEDSPRRKGRSDAGVFVARRFITNGERIRGLLAAVLEHRPRTMPRETAQQTIDALSKLAEAIEKFERAEKSVVDEMPMLPENGLTFGQTVSMVGSTAKLYAAFVRKWKEDGRRRPSIDWIILLLSRCWKAMTGQWPPLDRANNKPPLDKGRFADWAARVISTGCPDIDLNHADAPIWQALRRLPKGGGLGLHGVGGAHTDRA